MARGWRQGVAQVRVGMAERMERTKKCTALLALEDAEQGPEVMMMACVTVVEG